VLDLLEALEILDAQDALVFVLLIGGMLSP